MTVQYSTQVWSIVYLPVVSISTPTAVQLIPWSRCRPMIQCSGEPVGWCLGHCFGGVARWQGSGASSSALQEPSYCPSLSKSGFCTRRWSQVQYKMVYKTMIRLWWHHEESKSRSFRFELLGFWLGKLRTCHFSEDHSPNWFCPAKVSQKGSALSYASAALKNDKETPRNCLTCCLRNFVRCAARKFDVSSN